MQCVGRCFLIGSIHSGFFLFFPSSGLRRHLHGIEPFASQRVLSVSSHLEHKRSGLDPVWPSHCDQAVMARGEDALRPMWLMQASQTWKVKCSVGFFFFFFALTGTSDQWCCKSLFTWLYFTFFGNGCGTATVCWELGKGSCCQILHGVNSVSRLLLLAQRIWQRICKAINHKERVFWTARQ